MRVLATFLQLDKEERGRPVYYYSIYCPTKHGRVVAFIPLTLIATLLFYPKAIPPPTHLPNAWCVK